MKSQRIAIVWIAMTMILSACVSDNGGLLTASPTVDNAGDQETGSVETQNFQAAVNTSVVATLNAKPSNTPSPSDTPEATYTSPSSPDETPVGRATEVSPSERYDIPVEGQPFLGPEDAPIVIVEFSDFNCGYCRKWHQETFQSLLDAYPGQIRFVHRDYPFLSEESFHAAVAAQCAYEQDAFWGYHDRLFTRNEPKGSDTYLLFAQELGLNIQSFQACVESDSAVEAVITDAQFASDIGIRGTPTFFINGIVVIGAQPLQAFVSIIDQELGE
jgi:protein-disulfide isomerase